ncbi:MAG: sulfotransferase [Oceanospirillaceae bacterium]|nr:sulfotransferase [Oceanospirillaceae bacterium]
MLRDCLCKLDKVDTWPCDEINYIWRHGNVRLETDRFTKDQLTPRISSFIKREFDKIEKAQQADYVVEKTCANSLRVPFIDEIFPEGKYVCIIRDGFDVASSAAKRWKAPLDIPYIMAKAKYVPKSDLLYYASRYAWNRVKKLFSKEKRLAFWGPMYPGIHEDLKKYSASEVSALQWAACVKTSLQDFKAIEKDRVLYVRYESFVTQPVREMSRIVDFLNLKHIDAAQIEASVASVSVKSVGKSKSSFANEELEKLSPIIEPVQNTIDDHFQSL